MSRLQKIEEALKAINETVFQELCDSYLKLRNRNYRAFSRTGSMNGKQKTSKGTPDSFFLLPNGNYLYVEITTNQTDKHKLEKDIAACFDIKKTKIQKEKIEEIIRCFNWNIDQKEIETLEKIAKTFKCNITISYLTLQDLAIELHLHHRDLTHQYLGFPLDTGQIVSIERFVEEYNRASKGIATPLDNSFLHREKELEEIKIAICESDFVILTGAPGIGKTKLALEGIKTFLTENLTFDAYCVSYKHHTLLDDLYQYVESQNDYLLFVDDANRIDAFSQITGFYKAIRKGKLKIIITVRDYAFQDIGILCQDFSPRRLDLAKFIDEQIIDIVKAKLFDILNSDYQDIIVRIADGNPRLAIMTALLAKAEQNIYALHDVSDLFENYFSSFIKDDGEFAKPLNIKCLGLIAFFYTVPYKNREMTTSILENFGIEYSAFIDAIDKLNKLELVEIQFENVKISEQNLSTYFFYKAFIKDSLLDFAVLLNKYFESNRFRFRDTVIPAYNMMGGLQIEKQLKPKLQKYWKTIRNRKREIFEFLDIFWYLLMDETLEFAYGFVDSLPTVSTEAYKVAYGNNAFSYEKNIFIELIGEFFRYPHKNLKDTLELAFEFTRKEPEHLPELIHKIREQMTFDIDDGRYGFVRQIVLFQILIEGLNKRDALLSNVFYELSKTFLSFKFRHTKGVRNHTVSSYSYPVPNIPQMQQFRKRIWDALETNFQIYPNSSFELLQGYANITPDVSKNLMEFDFPLLVGIIEKHLTPSSFEHCKYVQDQIRKCKKNSVSHSSFKSLESKFRNPIYEVFLKIDWDRLRDKDIYDYDDYIEYERLKETEIRSSFLFKNSEQIKKFYSIFIYLKKAVTTKWNYNRTLDIVIDENCTKNFDLGCELLSIVIEYNNEVNYIPRIVFINHLKTKQKAEHIWNILQKQEFIHRARWELSFYECLDDTLLNINYIKALMNTVNNMKDANTIDFDRLKRLLIIEPNLFQIILKMIVEKNEKEGTQLQVWMDFFSDHFDQLGDDIELIKKAYLQQDKFDNHVDYEGKGFLNILKKDTGFLIEYAKKFIFSKKSVSSADTKNLSFVWQVDNIEVILNEVFDLAVQKTPYYGILKHFCNSFFNKLQGNAKVRAENFLIAYCKTNFADPDKINVVVDIVRHSMEDMFKEILLLFLTLNQDREIFSKIWWRGNGGSYTCGVIIGDIEAAEWKNILSIVEKSTVGIKLIPIKKYLNEQIEYCLKNADWERQQRFLHKDW